MSLFSAIFNRALGFSEGNKEQQVKKIEETILANKEEVSALMLLVEKIGKREITYQEAREHGEQGALVEVVSELNVINNGAPRDSIDFTSQRRAQPAALEPAVAFEQPQASC
tara:strand:- start:254 stop:589 length:336 start_codon:yes stop_codon:yes gene_type:complete